LFYWIIFKKIYNTLTYYTYNLIKNCTNYLGKNMELTELRSKIPEGLENHSVLWTMSEDNKKPHEVKSLDTTKPCVFFFGGGAYLATGEKSVLPQMKYMKGMLSQVIQQDKYNFYTLTSDAAECAKEDSMFNAGKKNQAYNDYPRMFFSKEAEAFVQSHLTPMIADIRNLQEDEREKAIASTAKNFSAITFLGFSYGTAFIQEISNALNLEMDKKGYRDTEKASTLNAISAVNIGLTFKFTPKYPDITQASLVLANDKDSVRESGISPSNTYLDFEHKAHGLMYAQKNNHTIVYSPHCSTRLRGLNYTNTTKNMPIESLIEAAKNWDTVSCDESSPVVLNNVVPAHNKQLQTASMRCDIEPESINYTFPSNLIGLNSIRFLQNSVIASAQALQNDSIRDTKGCMDKCISDHLNNESVDNDYIKTAFFQRLFDRLSNDNSHSI
jgi:hypothetical protein